MSEESRRQILSRLHAGARQPAIPISQPPAMSSRIYSQQDKIERLKDLMEAMRTEVHLVGANNWVNTVEDILRKRDVKSLLYAPETVIGDALSDQWKNDADNLPRLIPYEMEIDQMKERVFTVEAAITAAAGAIAETGAIILWPTEKEPRLMSIVPPLHIAVLKADTIHSSLSDAMQKENWPAQMPSNVVLVSGPSKTADIEMTLAFGVHGPKSLAVLILVD